MPVFKIDVVGLPECQTALRYRKEEKKAQAWLAMNYAAVRCQTRARERCPVDTGRLRTSIRVRFLNGGLAADVYTDVLYAPFVESGTRAHNVPAAVLAGWARRHGIPAGAVAKAIRSLGTQAHPFLFPAWEETKGELVTELQRVARTR